MKNSNIAYLKAGQKPYLQWLSAHNRFQITMPNGAFESKFVRPGLEFQYAMLFAKRYGAENLEWSLLGEIKK